MSLLRFEDQDFRPERVFCIGRNYSEHVREMGNEPAAGPAVFMKPASSLLPTGLPIRLPRHGVDLHHEVEIVLLLDPLHGGPASWDDVAGIALGLDLTLRDIQADLKARGLPWELAKSFEGSAPIGDFVARVGVGDPLEICFECRVNGEIRQSGRLGDMLFPVPRLLTALGQAWTLRSGDLVYTGTPAGVGPLQPGDRIELTGTGLASCAWDVAGRG
jgi:2-keto-4-pentenoate hydratase/2-oxohepta-3-ene-1,7-dioic acid hydratase in catechol pathway